MPGLLRKMANINSTTINLPPNAFAPPRQHEKAPRRRLVQLGRVSLVKEVFFPRVFKRYYETEFLRGLAAGDWRDCRSRSNQNVTDSNDDPSQ